jgi:hypothetical protein
MPTHEVIKLSEAELSRLVKTMPLNELETHIQTMLDNLGCSDYASTMLTLMRLIKDNIGKGDGFHRVQDYLRDTLPNKAMMSDLYARLAAMVMVFLVRKVGSNQ